MTEVVIDTNVLLVADGRHDEASDDCIATCIARLWQARGSGRIVIDDNYRILGEYQNKLRANSPNGVGGAFLKWLLQNQANRARVEQVTLTEGAPDHFDEFPVPALEQEFDPPDRKFPAVANAHPARPPILQATDSKWLKWAPALACAEVTVDFLCPEDVCRFYAQKFPGETLPELP